MIVARPVKAAIRAVLSRRIAVVETV